MTSYEVIDLTKPTVIVFRAYTNEQGEVVREKMVRNAAEEGQRARKDSKREYDAAFKALEELDPKRPKRSAESAAAVETEAPGSEIPAAAIPAAEIPGSERPAAGETTITESDSAAAIQAAVETGACSEIPAAAIQAADAADATVTESDSMIMGAAIQAAIQAADADADAEVAGINGVGSVNTDGMVQRGRTKAVPTPPPQTPPPQTPPPQSPLYSPTTPPPSSPAYSPSSPVYSPSPVVELRIVEGQPMTFSEFRNHSQFSLRRWRDLRKWIPQCDTAGSRCDPEYATIRLNDFHAEYHDDDSIIDRLYLTATGVVTCRHCLSHHIQCGATMEEFVKCTPTFRAAVQDALQRDTRTCEASVIAGVICDDFAIVVQDGTDKEY